MGLADEWQSRLDELADSGAVAACQDASSLECGEKLRQINQGLEDLSAALNEAGGAEAYPKTTKELAKATDSYASYRINHCAGSGGQDCYGDALTVSMGPTMLWMRLRTDEANAKG